MTAVPGALPITCVNPMVRTRGYALVPHISRVRLFAPAPPRPRRGCQIIAEPAAQSPGGPRRPGPDRPRPACAPEGCHFAVCPVTRRDVLDGKITAVVLRTVVRLLLRRLVGLVGLGQGADARDVEIAVLRHQLAVLRRQVKRPRYTPNDRLMLGWLARLLPRERWSAFLVTPATLVRWHRELVARRWNYPHTGRVRGLDSAVVEVVLRLARENPRWGYIRWASRCRRRRSAGSCAATASARHRGGTVGRPGCSFCARRPPEPLPATSSRSRRSA